MNSQLHAALLIGIVALITAGLRFAPFLIFGNRKTPKTVAYLGQVLPFSVMGMLVVYCLRNVNFTASPFGLPELVAGLCVVLLHLWKRNTLLSIIGGTLVYMLLVQFAF